MRFVDTNGLIYAVTPSPQEADKRRRAQELLEHGDLSLSVQVLPEFYCQVTQPNRKDPLTDTLALASLSPSTAYPCCDAY